MAVALGPGGWSKTQDPAKTPQADAVEKMVFPNQPAKKPGYDGQKRKNAKIAEDRG
jgi:hypothetical protein